MADIILALDLGTTHGWALRSKSGVITSGSIKNKQNRFQGGGMRYLNFVRWLSAMRHDLVDPISAVYFEEVRRHLGVDAAHAYGGYLAHLTAWAEERDIPYQGVGVGVIKKFATGKGNASKDDMIKAMRFAGHDPRDDNEADALALLHWAIDANKNSHDLSALKGRLNGDADVKDA